MQSAQTFLNVDVVIAWTLIAVLISYVFEKIMKYADKGYFDAFTPVTGDKLRLVCILTGHGLKDPDSAIKAAEEPVTVDAEEDAVLQAMQLQVPSPAGV